MKARGLRRKAAAARAAAARSPTGVAPELHRAYEARQDRILRRRIAIGIAIFLLGFAASDVIEGADHPDRLVVLWGSYALEAALCALALAALRAFPRPPAARTIVTVLFSALVALACASNAVASSSADTLAVALVCVLTGVAVLATPGLLGQAVVSAAALGSFLVAAPSLESADGILPPALGVAVGVFVGLLAAYFVERSTRQSFLQTLVAREEAEVSRALLRAGETLNANLRDPDVLERVARLAVEEMGCDWGATLVREGEGGCFALAAQSGLDGEGSRVLSPIRVGTGIEARLERGEVLELDAAQRAALSAALLGGESPTGREIWAPIRAQGGLLGVLAFGFRSPDAVLSGRERRLARGMAQAAAVAYANSRLLHAAEEASRLKTEFVATMSHELRTPLHVILGYLGLLSEGALGPLEAEQRHAIQASEHAGLDLLELVNRVLDLSRLEAGQEPVERTRFRLDELLGELAEELRPIASPGVQLELACALGEREVVSDREKLKTVVRNLIANALKFTERGRVEVEARIWESGVEIAVRDTGIGIAPEHLESIFEMFRQADSSPSRRHGGVGLGLYIVRRLVELLGGEVSVESRSGEGSTFRVALPGALAAPEAPGARPAENARAPA